MRKYENIWKLATWQGNYYTTGCLIDYPYFKKYYKMIAIDLSKHQVLDADPKAIQHINFTGNLNQEGNTSKFFTTEGLKETILDFSKGTVRAL